MEEKECNWISNPSNGCLLTCSNCGSYQMVCEDGGGCEYKTPYCPWCGAKMKNSEFPNGYKYN